MRKFGNAKNVPDGDGRKVIDLPDRLLDFTASVVKLANAFPSNFAGKHIGGQLIRSACSVGANFEESRGAESRQDFVHKLQIAFKEAKETMYWLRLSRKLEFGNLEQMQRVIGEGHEIQLILGKSVVTTKENSA